MASVVSLLAAGPACAVRISARVRCVRPNLDIMLGTETGLVRNPKRARGLPGRAWARPKFGPTGVKITIQNATVRRVYLTRTYPADMHDRKRADQKLRAGSNARHKRAFEPSKTQPKLRRHHVLRRAAEADANGR
eukprot:4517563-Prymnesium_polylepis.1